MDANRYALETIPSPPVFPGAASPVMSDETLHRRLAAIIERMQQQQIAQLIIDSRYRRSFRPGPALSV